MKIDEMINTWFTDGFNEHIGLQAFLKEEIGKTIDDWADGWSVWSAMTSKIRELKEKLGILEKE